MVLRVEPKGQGVALGGAEVLGRSSAPASTPTSTHARGIYLSKSGIFIMGSVLKKARILVEKGGCQPQKNACSDFKNFKKNLK